jgi:hypothetical protein
MKTTVEIEDRLLRQAKKVAIDRGTTLRQLIEAGLKLELEKKPTPRPIQWVTASGHFPEGLDLSSRQAMMEWLERENSSAEPDAGAAPLEP